MRARGFRSIVLALCVGSLCAGAQRAPLEYWIWAGAPPTVASGPSDATYVFDERWHQRVVSHDGWVLARASTERIRMQARPRRWWASFGGKLMPAECNVGPTHWALGPSGTLAACVDGNYPGQIVHIMRTIDGRRTAIIPVSDAYVEGRNQITFADNERLLIATLDDSCRRERLSQLSYSITEIPLSHPAARRIRFPCASGVIAGTSRVAYLRESGTEYSVDGGRWERGPMYGLDREDNPITDDSPALKSFAAKHRDLAVWLISVGEASN